MPHQHENNPELEQCIRDCLACYQRCQQDAMTHCLPTGGRHVEPEHFRLMMDCAEICRSAAVLMMNESPFHQELCGLCATVCDECAQSCRALDDMEECAEACERCSESCTRMASSGGRSGREQRQQTQPMQ